MDIVAIICLRFYIEVGVGVGTFLPTLTAPKIPAPSHIYVVLQVVPDRTEPFWHLQNNTCVFFEMEGMSDEIGDSCKLMDS
jgi:hypothetical protein